MRPNPARSPHPDVGLLLVEPGPEFLEAWQLVLIDTSTDALLGYMAMIEPDRCGPDTASVFGAGAVKDWGPALYDTALEFARERGWWLSPDRRSISERARPLWVFYLEERKDVVSEPLKRSLTCPFYGEPELDRRYRFKPGIKVAGPLAPDRARKFERMREIGDALVSRTAAQRGSSEDDVRNALARRALAHFSEIYKNLLRAGTRSEHAFSPFDVAVLAGMAFFVGGTVGSLTANPRARALKQRLLR